jgi:hypothetical protein
VKEHRLNGLILFAPASALIPGFQRYPEEGVIRSPDVAEQTEPYDAGGVLNPRRVCEKVLDLFCGRSLYAPGTRHRLQSGGLAENIVPSKRPPLSAIDWITDQSQQDRGRPQYEDSITGVLCRDRMASETLLPRRAPPFVGLGERALKDTLRL